MAQFFSSWQHKTGMLTLLLALAILAAWVRSDSLHDAFGIPIGDTRAIGLLSANRRIGFYVTTDSGIYRVPKQPVWETFKAETFPALFPSRAGFSWGWQFFEFGHVRHSSDHVMVWIVPYWFIVIPLSLLSTWLLVMKPQEVEPGKVEHHPVEKK